jgi:arylsulfatase A-like enzyme
VTPGASGSGESFGDFAEDIRAPDTAGAEAEEPAPEFDGNGNVIPIDEQQLLDGFFATGLEAQPTRLEAFVDALRPTDDPFLAYLHLLLPHQPWLAREDGTQYDLPGDNDDEPDVSAPWRARVTRQRQLLQAEYTDRLLGLILDRLKEVGEYDDALIVVVSDHGVSFEPEESTRSVSAENLEQIAYAPLLIKAPGQVGGSIDDANLMSIDLAPTIAELLGAELTWDVDGLSAAETDAVAGRGGDKYIYSYTDAFSYEFLGIEDFADDTRYQAMLAGRFPGVGADESRLGGLYEGQPGADLIGRPAADVLRPGDGEAQVRELDALRRPSKPELLAEVAGVVRDAGPDDIVVVAVNGTVVGVSPLFENGAAANQFVVLLPAEAMQADDNEIQVGVLDANGSVAAELELVGID